jgi:hypothetical protein
VERFQIDAGKLADFARRGKEKRAVKLLSPRVECPSLILHHGSGGPVTMR